jgi:hypothetical protein
MLAFQALAQQDEKVFPQVWMEDGAEAEEETASEEIVDEKRFPEKEDGVAVTEYYPPLAILRLRFPRLRLRLRPRPHLVFCVHADLGAEADPGAAEPMPPAIHETDNHSGPPPVTEHIPINSL